MSEENKNRQQLACHYIQDNYVAFQRLRFDCIAQKVQLREEESSPQHLPDGQGDCQMRWRYITNADINSMVCDCCAETGANISAKEILTVLNAGSRYIPRVHPLREYVLSLRPYTPDQPDWIDMVARQVTVKPTPTPSLKGGESSWQIKSFPSGEDLGEATALWHQCFKKWFVAMVASWLKDEVVNHQVLVLIGRQGIFKTTWLEHLIPPHLRAYCCKLANATQLSKDDRLRIAEFGLINMDELDAMTPRELNAMKSVITSTDVNERAAYGRLKERRVRLASFCASTNNREFLTDITGNRRWLPFEVESIQNPFDDIILYERLYAQAKAYVECGYFAYWFDMDEIEVLEQHNEKFRALENEEELLPLLFDKPAEGKGEVMTTAEISDRLATYGGIKKPMSIRKLNAILEHHEYKAVRPYVDGKQVRGWLVYRRKQDEIEIKQKELANKSQRQEDTLY